MSRKQIAQISFISEEWAEIDSESNDDVAKRMKQQATNRMYNSKWIPTVSIRFRFSLPSIYLFVFAIVTQICLSKWAQNRPDYGTRSETQPRNSSGSSS